jgi:hypothetical protein
MHDVPFPDPRLLLLLLLLVHVQAPKESRASGSMQKWPGNEERIHEKSRIRLLPPSFTRGRL